MFNFFSRHKLLVGYIITFFLALLLYICTIAPDIVWQDQGDYQYLAAKLNLNQPGDVVRVHPLFIITAHLAGKTGLFSYAYASNLVSAISTALSIANIYLIVFLLTSRIWPSVISSAVCALGHSTWFLGVQAQTYGLANAAFTGCIILFILYIQKENVKFLYCMGLVAGLGISAHMMSQVGFAVLMVFLMVEVFQRKLKIRDYTAIVFCWFIGAFLLWYVVYLEYNRSGDLTATLLSAIYGKWGKAVFNIGRFGYLIKNSILFFVLNFPTPIVLFALPGIYLSFKKLKKSLAIVLLSSLILYVLFAMRYDVPNQNNFFLPSYILISIYIGMGYSFIFKNRKFYAESLSLILILMIVPAYLFISYFASSNNIPLGTKRKVPYRDDYKYYLLPWQHTQTGPRRLTNDVYNTVPENAAIFPDSTIMRCFKYTHEIEGKRPDIILGGNFEELPLSYLREMFAGRRLFVFSDVKNYYPRWVKDSSWLRPFMISDSEYIFEVIIPDNTHN